MTPVHTTTPRHSPRRPQARAGAASRVSRRGAWAAAFALCAPPLAVAYAEIEVEVTALDGRVVRGSLVSVVPELVVRAESGDAPFSWEELLALRPTAAASSSPAASPLAAPWHFSLTDGSQFAGALESAEPAGVHVQLATGEELTVDSSSIASLATAHGDEDARRKLQDAQREPDRSEDVAVVRGDGQTLVLRGALRGFESRRILFNWKDRELPIPWERLAGLLLARTGQPREAVLVRTATGDVFAGSVVAGDDAGLTLRSAALGALRIPWERIERIDSRAARVVYLSAVEPDGYEFEPLLERRWPLERDRSLAGGPIRVGGRAYSRGIVMHSRSRAVYTLGGSFRNFAAVVGVADEVGRFGDAAVRVLGDGRVLWEVANLRGGEPPVELTLNITGVKRLELVVDYGDALDLGDRVAWADARLVP